MQTTCELQEAPSREHRSSGADPKPWLGVGMVGTPQVDCRLAPAMDTLRTLLEDPKQRNRQEHGGVHPRLLLASLGAPTPPWSGPSLPLYDFLHCLHFFFD